MSQDHYMRRINCVIDYITAHLDGDLSLTTLAQVAHFSPYHFHRIFKSCVGETLNQFVNRVRVERAAVLLRSDPHLRILDAALMCGYESAAGFSRAFKKRYQIAPRTWDRSSPLEERKIGQAGESFPVYTVNSLCEMANDDDFQVCLRHIPAQSLACLRVYDAYRQWQAIQDSYDRLIDWYTEQGGSLQQTQLYGMSQDDPDVTPVEQCRFDWCLRIAPDCVLPDDLHRREMPAFTVAAIHVQGDLHLLDRALQYLWRYWLPRSAYQPADLPAMEIYQQLPHQIGWKTYDLWAAVPVIKL